MPSMYETIMELPLFKGIGTEQLSQLLEKTSVEFLNFEDGEIIHKEGDNVRQVDFILNGRVKNAHHIENYKIGIDEIIGKGGVVGALFLFGRATTYPAEVVSMGKVSVMRISKSDYMNILLSDRIYMLNFVNYLSAAAQKGGMLIQKKKTSGITATLYFLSNIFASRSAETVVLVGSDSDIADYCGVRYEAFEAWKLNELSNGRIIVNSRGIILRSPHLADINRL